MRGNPWIFGREGMKRRSIPAHAGEPVPDPVPTKISRVYPRACGGTQSVPVLVADDGGLSPRMRGNHENFGASSPSLGSIPAHAGEPGGGLISRRTVRVYPRACGGTTAEDFVVLPGGGLSPRMRGNRQLRPRPGAGPGSIPAHAGEATQRRTAPAGRWVYPRACGGSWVGELASVGNGGLSPRMRGKLPAPHQPGFLFGSIPAHAGEASSCPIKPCSSWVYPRACGGSESARFPLSLE